MTRSVNIELGDAFSCDGFPRSPLRTDASCNEFPRWLRDSTLELPVRLEEGLAKIMLSHGGANWSPEISLTRAQIPGTVSRLSARGDMSYDDTELRTISISRRSKTDPFSGTTGDDLGKRPRTRQNPVISSPSSLIVHTDGLAPCRSTLLRKSSPASTPRSSPRRSPSASAPSRSRSTPAARRAPGSASGAASSSSLP